MLVQLPTALFKTLPPCRLLETRTAFRALQDIFLSQNRYKGSNLSLTVGLGPEK